MTRVAILGGGPAGVGGAWRLHTEGKGQAILFERGAHFGGNAGSFEDGGHHLDYGSHRLHPATEPQLLADIQRVLGADLLNRPRHGRIRLLGKWVHFPLKPVDLFLHLEKSFALGSLRDALAKSFRKNGVAPDDETFATVLEEGLGRTICEHFYFPYAVKLWGAPPETLSPIQAKKRVSASGFLKLIKKVLTSVPGLKPPMAGRFFYPRQGFGQISSAIAEEARKAGAELNLGWEVEAVQREGEGWSVRARRGEETRTVTVDHVWSTLPVTLLARMLDPAPPEDVLTHAFEIDYRAMLLIYLELDQDRFTEFDAHYFPGADVTITRLSEPKNYAARSEPRGRTVLCAELPCARNDAHWRMSDAELGELVQRDLQTSGIPLPAAPLRVFTRRLPQAYPIYQKGYEHAFEPLDAWVDGVPRLLSYGRQGLFAHDNTHHALAMAYAAVDCLEGGAFDRERWATHREHFRSHVVED